MWLGRNIAYFQHELNATIVKQGILTADEVKYVSWSVVNLTSAGWYQNVNFTVKLASATVTHSVTLNMNSGEITAQIGTKFKQHPVQFNYNWWNGKNLLNYLPELRNMIVNEVILTRVETSEIVGLFNIFDPSYYKVTGTGGFYIDYNINDNNTDNSAYYYGVNVVNVVNDGDSAQQLASKINSGDNYHISKNDVGLYSDEGTPEHDIKVQLAKYSFTYTQVNYVQMPHVILKPVNNNVVFNIKKDGQIASAIPCMISCNQ